MCTTRCSGICQLRFARSTLRAGSAMAKFGAANTHCWGVKQRCVSGVSTGADLRVLYYRIKEVVDCAAYVRHVAGVFIPVRIARHPYEIDKRIIATRRED